TATPVSAPSSTHSSAPRLRGRSSRTTDCLASTRPTKPELSPARAPTAPLRRAALARAREGYRGGGVGESGATWTTMLLGGPEQPLDDKNRLTLPARLRAAFEDGVVVTRGLDGCLFAYPRAAWEQMAQRIQSLDPLSSEARVMQRHFFAGAAQG